MSSRGDSVWGVHVRFREFASGPVLVSFRVMSNNLYTINYIMEYSKSRYMYKLRAKSCTLTGSQGSEGILYFLGRTVKKKMWESWRTLQAPKFCLCFFGMMQEIKPRALYMLGECSSPELYTKP
jgi:hypothetical protein